MIKFLGIAVFLILSMTVQASEYKCSDWTKKRGVSCIFAGSSADVYERQCENSCWRGRYGRGNWGPDCDMEKVCSPSSPATFEGVCSEWTRNRSVSCRNPNTGDWEQRWVRVCTVGLKESWCSDADPNRL